jgi:hypothetical protein
MNMKIKVGDFDVYESGSVVGNDNEPIDFIIDATVDFTVRLAFVTDTNQKEHSAKADKFGQRGVQITFINYNNSLGTGNITPLKLGRLNGRELFLNYRIYCLDKGGKHIHYTWLLGKEVANG